MKVRHRHGATLGLIAVCVLFVIVIGFAFYFLAKFMGAGREATNAGDAGCLNVAKQLMRHPGRDAASFPNPDVRTNFEVYSDELPGGIRRLNLLTYNRCFSHAAFVLNNARELGTTTSAIHARQVCAALHDVGRELRIETGSRGSPGPSISGFFNNIATANNTKMLNGNSVTLAAARYDIGFARRGQSANVYFNPAVSVGLSGGVPINTGGGGYIGNPSLRYIAGYAPLSVTLAATGERLSISAVPVGPVYGPHLIPQSELNSSNSDVFAVGIPAGALPANCVATTGRVREPKTGQFIDAVASAIVGCQYPGNAHQFQFDMQYGYLKFVNGPAVPIPAVPISNAENDIFNNELAAGIAYQALPSSDVLFTDRPNWGGPNGWNAWASYNAGTGPRPNYEISKRLIKKNDGSTNPTLEDLRELRAVNTFCLNTHFPGRPDCERLVELFKAGFERWGSYDEGYGSDRFTSLEKWKLALAAARNRSDSAVTVLAPTDPSGVKLFDHNEAYAGTTTGIPNTVALNFGRAASPMQYLEMIDQMPIPASGCATTTIFKEIYKRCNQIKPGITPEAVRNVLRYGQESRGLRSVLLPLGGELYLFREGNNLVMRPTAPDWITPSTTPDGTPIRCGYPYDVVFNYVNTRRRPGSRYAGIGDLGFHRAPFDGAPSAPGQSTCRDMVTQNLCSGYQHLLGVWEFDQTCSGGGEFSQPN